eukprot:1761083-Rhodomonas_salina.3
MLLLGVGRGKTATSHRGISILCKVKGVAGTHGDMRAERSHDTDERHRTLSQPPNLLPPDPTSALESTRLRAHRSADRGVIEQKRLLHGVGSWRGGGFALVVALQSVHRTLRALERGFQARATVVQHHVDHPAVAQRNQHVQPAVVDQQPFHRLRDCSGPVSVRVLPELDGLQHHDSALDHVDRHHFN